MKFNRLARLALVAIAALGVTVLFADTTSATALWTVLGFGLFGMAVTADQLVNKSGEAKRNGGPVAASTTIYGGTLVFINSSGYADDDTATGANSFAGVADKRYDNSSGSNGDINAEWYTDGDFVLEGSSFTQGDVGAKIYASDNFTVTTTSASNTFIGKCVEFVSSTKIKVRLETVTD